MVYGICFRDQKKSMRQRIREAEDDDLVDPIYRYYDKDLLGEESRAPSLHEVLMSILKSTEKFKSEYRLAFVITYLAAGHGGEAKFLNYLDWSSDESLQSLTLLWRESKTIQRYPMAFGPDSFLWTCDIFHAQASYWCTPGVDGLFRLSSSNIPLGIKCFVFQRFRPEEYNDGWLTKTTTKVLSKFTDESYNVTSKSIRRGAVTSMMLHEKLDSKFVTIRSGHVAYDNSRFYYHGTSAGSLPGFKALVGWPLPHARVYCPRLTALSIDSTIMHTFMDNLYLTDLALFSRKGKLYRLLEICTASLLRFFADVNRDLDHDNILTNKMIDALSKTDYKLGDDDTPMKVLKR